MEPVTIALSVASLASQFLDLWDRHQARLAAAGEEMTLADIANRDAAIKARNAALAEEGQAALRDTQRGDEEQR